LIIGQTKNDVDKLWLAFHSGGITNPITVIEQINYLLFCRRLDDIEKRNERIAERTKVPVKKRIFSVDDQELRWSNFEHLEARQMFDLVRDKVFPFIKGLGSESDVVSTFSKTLSDAVFQIPKASMLSAAVSLVSNLDLDNSDTAGDLYEYLLSKLQISGINGQFRTPRHIIRMMVEIVNPIIGERICDPACGTGGFLFSALQYILEKNTSENLVQVDEDGYRHGFVGDKLNKSDRKKFETDSFYGFDIDPAMLRVAAMNIWLHGIEEPNVLYADSLSKNFAEINRYDLILANPPFKGQLDYADCSPALLSEVKTKKTELLFLALSVRILDVGGRAAIVVPEGVLFGSSTAHVQIRRLLLEDNQLEAVISMPAGVFKPYAGVSTAILLFTKGGATERVWFYDMEHDGFTLDDKRQPTVENDIPDIIECWKAREDRRFEAARSARMSELRNLMTPLKLKKTELLTKLNGQKFNEVLNAEGSETSTLPMLERDLRKQNSAIQTLQSEFNRLSRQFWVPKQDILDAKYDLSSDRYRQVERDEQFCVNTPETLARIDLLESALAKEFKAMRGLTK
jgi:type I restriction enzyme M protein